jgi:hypothetical protein
MDIKDFDMLSDGDIDYSSLDGETLSALALKADDQFIRTNSLSELKSKDQALALDMADAIWNKMDGDKYLLAQALTLILEFDGEKGLNILNEKIKDSDAYILQAVVNFFIDEGENYQFLRYFDDVKKVISSRIIRGDLASYDDDGYLREQWEGIISKR